jgi:hypothetical protein
MEEHILLPIGLLRIYIVVKEWERNYFKNMGCELA